MISNLPDDVVHDLIKDLDVNGQCFESTKTIIETWEANRDKYLASVKKDHCIIVDASLINKKDLFNIPPGTITVSGKLPDGSGFIVP